MSEKTFYIEIRFKVEAESIEQAEEKLDNVINSKHYDELTHEWED